LHQEAGSGTVVEIHGSLLERLCLGCGLVDRVDRNELLEGLDHAIRALRTAFVPSFVSLLPRCRRCGSPTRPGTVAFGEMVRSFPEAERLAGRCATMLVVGTSGEVEPAASLPRLAREAGALVVRVGLGPTWITADLELTGPAGRSSRTSPPGRPGPGIPHVPGASRIRAGITEGGGPDMPVFPGEEWLDEYVERINQSKEYKEAAATWEGDVAYVFEPEPDKGVPDEVWAWLDLWHGECRSGKLVTAEEGEKAKFIIRAPYSRWKEVIKKELDPVKGMMQGKLKLKGDLPTIVRYVKAANELVNLAQTVPTEFVDETV